MVEGKVGKILYPDFIASNYIFTHPKLNEELEKLIELSGYKKEFTKKFRRALIFLENLRENCIFNKSFERLVNNGDIYSMRLMGNKNIRILFVFTNYCDQEIAVLLYAFEEKDRKVASKHSYETAIDIAIKRVKELIN